MKKQFISTLLSLSLVVSFVYYISINESSQLNEKVAGDVPKGANKMVNYFAEKTDQNVTDEQHMQALKEVYQQNSQSNKVTNQFLEWEELGPNNVGGRTRAIVVDKDNSDLIYAAGVTGGLFISQNGGDLWENYAFNEVFPTLSIGQLRQAANGDLILSTGEPNHGFGTNIRGAFSVGMGLFRITDKDAAPILINSTDPMQGANEFMRVNKVECHPTNADIIYVATNSGLRRTVDGGNTWTNPINSSAVAHDVRIAKVKSDGSDASNLIYVGLGNVSYRSIDGGITFQAMGNAEDCINASNTVNTGGGSRTEIAISPTNADVAYISLVNGGGQLIRVIQTTNGGECWRVIGTYDEYFLSPYTQGDNSQGWYDNAIAVDPSDPFRIFIGGITLWTWSGTGGWNQINTLFGSANLNPFYVHADIHAFTFDPKNPDIFFVGCDGGIFRSFNATEAQPSFIARNKNYNVTQYYSVAADFLGRVVGGTQDNSCPYVDYQGITEQEAKILNGGDGAFTEISDIDPNIMFLASQDNNVVRSSNRGESTGGFISDDTDLQGSLFIAPYHLWEDLPYWQELQEIDMVLNLINWTIVGEDTTRNVILSVDPDNIPNGVNPNFFDEITETVMTDGMRMDSINSNRGARWFGGASRVIMLDNPLEISQVSEPRRLGTLPGGGAQISSMSTSKDGDILWVGSDNGSLMRVRGLNDDNNYTTTGSGANTSLTYNAAQVNTYSTNTLPWGSFVSSINPNPNNAQEVVVTIATGNTDKIYYSSNALSTSPTWTSIQHNFNDDLSIYEAIFDQNFPSRIYMGTEVGMWALEDVADPNGTWVDESAGIGKCRVVRIRQEPMNDVNCPVIYLATYGRGLWRSVSSTSAFQNCNTELPRYNVSIEDDEIYNSDKNMTVSISPNPMVNFAKLTFNLSKQSKVIAQIYSLNGQKVQDYNFGNLGEGNHTMDIEREELIAGKYVVVVSANGKTKSTKLIVQ